MQETVPQTTRTQYSLLDLLVLVLIFGSHMALMTQHYLAGVDYALAYTCFALGVTLVLFIVSQRNLEAARAHRPVAFFACAFLVFGFFHWVTPSTTANSEANAVLSKYKLADALPADAKIGGSSSSYGQGTYSAEYESLQTFTTKSPVRGVVLNRVIEDLSAKMKEKGASVSNAGSSSGGSNDVWQDSRSLDYTSHGWRGRVKISVGNRSSPKQEQQYTLEIQSIEIRR